MKKIIIATVVLILAIGAAFFVMQGTAGQTTGQTTAASDFTPANIKTFTVDGGLGYEYSFLPRELRVNERDTVRIVFKNRGRIIHNLILSDFGAGTDIIGPGASDEISFVADKSGNFEFFCSVPGHRERGMFGALMVE